MRIGVIGAGRSGALMVALEAISSGQRNTVTVSEGREQDFAELYLMEKGFEYDSEKEGNDFVTLSKRGIYNGSNSNEENLGSTENDSTGVQCPASIQTPYHLRNSRQKLHEIREVKS